MMAYRVLFAACALLFAAPLAYAQTDPPACAPYRAKWVSVASADDVAAMDGVIKVIPSLCSALAGEAKARRAAVQKEIAARDPCIQARAKWADAQSGSEVALRAYRDNLPAACGMWRSQAQDRLNALESQRMAAESQRAAAAAETARRLAIARQPIVLQARNFTRGANVAVDACTDGPGILANARPCNAASNMAEWDFTPTASGEFQMDIEYAALTSRPVTVYVNNVLTFPNAISGTTGGWSNAYLAWRPLGILGLYAGKPVTVRLQSTNVFPHIRTIRFTMTKAY